MKITIEKIYYEEDVYEFPENNRSLHYPGMYLDGPYQKKIKKNDVMKAELDYKKGEIKEIKIKDKKYCCSGIGRDTIMGGLTYMKIFAKREYTQGRPLIPGCYVRVCDSEYENSSRYILINYCPFCGEKIEVIEEKGNKS